MAEVITLPDNESGIRALEAAMMRGKEFPPEEAFAIGLVIRRLSGNSWRSCLARRLIGFRPTRGGFS